MFRRLAYLAIWAYLALCCMAIVVKPYISTYDTGKQFRPIVIVGLSLRF